MAGFMDLLPLVGGIFDSFKDDKRYDQQAGLTREQLDFQKELLNKAGNWQEGSNTDILDYILGNNPLMEGETAGYNEGESSFADYINSLRQGYAYDVNDEIGNRTEGADNLAGSNFGRQNDLASGQEDISSSILDIANSRDPAAYIKQSERMAGELGDNPYDLNSMMADAEQAAQMGVDRQYGKAMENASRDSTRQGTDASQTLLDLTSAAARDNVEATLKARLGTPQSYESTMATRQGRIGQSMSALEGAAGGIDARALSGGSAAANVLSGASQGMNAATKLGVDTLLHRPEYEDVSTGLRDPLGNFKSVIGSRTNPYAALTNPYSGLKPAIPAYPAMAKSNTGDTLSYGISQLFGR